MPANLENSAVATGLEKVSFHSNPKERQCQTVLKLPHSCTHFTCLQSNVQNSPSQASTMYELPDVQAGFRKGRGTKLPTSIGSSEKWESSRKNLLYWLCQSLWLCGSQQTVGNSERDGNTRSPDLPPEKSVCRSRTGHGTTDWFQIRKGVCQGCILSPCLFNLYAEYIMRNPGLAEAQAGIKIAGRNINNLRYMNPYGRKWRTKEPLVESERVEWKSWLKTQHSEN